MNFQSMAVDINTSGTKYLKKTTFISRRRLKGKNIIIGFLVALESIINHPQVITLDHSIVKMQ